MASRCLAGSAARTSARLLAALVVAAAPACLDREPETEAGPGLVVAVSPLTLRDLTEATYTITVRNGLGAVVWSAGPLSSLAYGNGSGSLTYIGPCDASRNPHSVELVLESLRDSGGWLSSPVDYVNPTIQSDGARTPLVIGDVPCDENRDTRVTFDVTVLRRATQGFLDIALDFDDIFCSAKADCKPSLLHRPDGSRGPTVVVAFACASGTGQSTFMYGSDLVLSCTANPAVPGQLPLSHVVPLAGARPGQKGPIAPGIYGWALYSGRELPDRDDLEKCYRNVAIGLDTAALTGRSCTLSALATASQAPLMPGLGATGYQIPKTGAYPYVRWQLEVLSADGQLCDNHELDDPARDGVSTGYVTGQTDLATLPTLTVEKVCGEGTPVPCPGATHFGDVVALATDDGFRVRVGDDALAASFRLPDGHSLADSCCTPSCCDGPRELVCDDAAGGYGALTATGTGSGFILAANDPRVAPIEFSLPPGHHLGDRCCKSGCTGLHQLECQEGDFGVVRAEGTGTGFVITASDPSIAPVAFALPADHSLGDRCCTPGCCLSP